MTIIRDRDPLQGQRLRVLGRMRRGSGVELLVVLADGSKRLIPAAWTDAQAVGGGTTQVDAAAGNVALGSVVDLLAVCAVVAGLAVRAEGGREQAARQSPAKEDHRAACPAQSAAGDVSGTIVHCLADTTAAIGTAGPGVAGVTGAPAGRGDRPDGPSDRPGGPGAGRGAQP